MSNEGFSNTIQPRSILNRFFKFLLQGVDAQGVEQSVAVHTDRSLKVYTPLIAFDGERNRVILADAQAMLRMRPYEALLPVESLLMPGSLAAVYTSTSRRSRVRVDVTNSANNAAATCQVMRKFDSGSGGFAICAGGTPVPTGVPIRLGFWDLDPGGSIEGSSNPPNSCTLHITVDRYNETGDTP